VSFLFTLALKLQKVPGSWGEGVVISLFKKGDVLDPGNYRGITLLGAVRKLFCRVVATRLTGFLEDSDALHEGQAGFRPGRSCEDHIFTLSQVVQGRRRGDLKTYAFFLDVKKAYDSVWREGLWFKLWEKGIRGRLLQTLMALYASSASRVAVNGELADPVPIGKGVAQGCTLSCILFDIFVDDLLQDLEAQGFGVPFGTGEGSDEVPGKLAALMFADDFVGLESSPERLQVLIECTERWCSRWGLEANVLKCAIVVFHGDAADKEHNWTWGDVQVPVVSSYTYLGVEFSENCRWDVHTRALVNKGLKAVGTYSRLLRAQCLSVAAKRTILLTAIRPVLDYASGVWQVSEKDCEKLEVVQLKAAKAILQCAGTTPSIAVRGDLGLQLLRVRRAVASVCWRRRVECMGAERYPRKVMAAHWHKDKPGGEVKSWKREVAKLLTMCDVRVEDLPDLSVDDLSSRVLSSFPKLEGGEGGGEVKLPRDSSGRKIIAYSRLGDRFGLQPYLQGCLSLGARLKFKFRAGSHGLGEEMVLRSKVERPCGLCDGEVESVAHFMLVCPALENLRAPFLSSLQAALGDNKLQDFQILPPDTQAQRLLADSPWGCKAGEVDCLLQDFITRAWKLRCNMLHKEKSYYYQEETSVSAPPPFSSPCSISNSSSVWCRRGVHGLRASTCENL
jgi:hypothetical protein